LTVDLFAEESSAKPLFNPKLILNIDKDTLTDENAKLILLKAHTVAAEKGTLYFANTQHKEGKYHVFSGTGSKFETDLTGDWETDTMRTACLGTVTLNLPRIAQESEKDRGRFLGLLKERCELAARAVEIKRRMLKLHGKNMLPFLSQKTNGDTYIRLENSSSLLNLAGLRESVDTFCQKAITGEDSTLFAEEIAQTIISFKSKTGRKQGKRFFTAILPNQEASERLAQLDIEKYGLAKVKFSGSREKPYYSTSIRLSVRRGDSGITLGSMENDQRLQRFNTGGDLRIIELEEPESRPEELMNLTTQIIERQIVGFFTYNRKMSYCPNCKKSWFGLLHKCPSCGSMSTLTLYDRFSST
jgi:ribonucleoside-triphosphate reductase